MTLLNNLSALFLLAITDLCCTYRCTLMRLLLQTCRIFLRQLFCGSWVLVCNVGSLMRARLSLLKSPGELWADVPAKLVLAASSCDHSRQNGAFWEKGKTLLKASLLRKCVDSCWNRGLTLFTAAELKHPHTALCF